LLSSNQFDRSVESGMTAAFVVGPTSAVAGLVAGLILTRAGACHRAAHSRGPVGRDLSQREK
jgi:hypothetical protein